MGTGSAAGEEEKRREMKRFNIRREAWAEAGKKSPDDEAG